MATYALKTFLRNTPNVLLKQYLSDKSLLDGFPWTKEEKKKTVEIGEMEIDGLADAIDALPENDFATTDHEFRNITDMADDNGVQCLIEQAESRLHNIKLVKEFEENKVEGYYGRAMWVFLKHKNVFEYAFQNQYLDGISNWKDREVGPEQPCDTGNEAKAELGKAIAKYFKDKGRGRYCQVDYYHRTTPDRDCFFAYPEDCAKPEQAYDNKGKLSWASRRPVFEVVFMYEKKTGLLRVHARGAKNTKAMQGVFCQKILGLKELPDKSTLVYNLSKLKDKTFRFVTEPCIERIKLKMLMLDLPDRERVIIEADPKDGNEMALYDRMMSVVEAYNVDLSRVYVKKARMQAIFRPDEGGKRKPLTFTLGCPDSCSLEDKYHDNIIRRHIDEKWGFRRKLMVKTPEEGQGKG